MPSAEFRSRASVVSAGEVVGSDAVRQPFSAAENTVVAATCDYENYEGGGEDNCENARRRQIRVLHTRNFAGRTGAMVRQRSKITVFRNCGAVKLLRFGSMKAGVSLA